MSSLRWKWPGIGAASGGAFALSLVILSDPGLFPYRLEREFARLIFSPVLIGTVFGCVVGLAFSVTRLKQRVNLVWLIPSWGLVCGVAASVISYVPLSVWCYVGDFRWTAVDHSPRSIGKAFYNGIPLSLLAFPIGFILGAIVAPFKQAKEGTAEAAAAAADGGREA